MDTYDLVPTFAPSRTVGGCQRRCGWWLRWNRRPVFRAWDVTIEDEFMMKARGVIKGRPTYIIGLSFGNLDRFRAEPGDTYINIPKEESGLSDDILLVSGRTEAEMAALIQSGIGPGTEVFIDPKLKS